MVLNHQISMVAGQMGIIQDNIALFAFADAVGARLNPIALAFAGVIVNLKFKHINRE